MRLPPSTQTSIVNRDSKCLDAADSAHRIQNVAYIAERQPYLSQSDSRELIQDLDTDGPALGKQMLNAVSLVDIL
jgi:hypothetical protein